MAFVGRQDEYGKIVGHPYRPDGNPNFSQRVEMLSILAGFEDLYWAEYLHFSHIDSPMGAKGQFEKQYEHFYFGDTLRLTETWRNWF